MRPPPRQPRAPRPRRPRDRDHGGSEHRHDGGPEHRHHDGRPGHRCSPSRSGSPTASPGSARLRPTRPATASTSWSEYVNANGGINGRPLEVIMLDDKSDVPPAHRQHQQADPGGQGRCDRRAVRPVHAGTGPRHRRADRDPHGGHGPGHPRAARGHDAVPDERHALGGPARPSADALTKVIKANGWKNILAYRRSCSPSTRRPSTCSCRAGPTEGFTFTKLPDTFGFDQTDFQPILNKIMEAYNAQKPDAVAPLRQPDRAAAALQGPAVSGRDVPIQGSPAAAHPAIFAMGPDAVEGLPGARFRWSGQPGRPAR